MTDSLHSPEYKSAILILRQVRLEKDLTQQQVAKRLGKPQSYIAKIEGGERRIDVAEFARLAEVLESDPVVLFKRILKSK